MFKKKRQLEIALQDISPHENPRVELEQYSTPSIIAADLLWNAHAIGDIEGLKIADLGCGTGILSIGSALMGAEDVVGVDIDSNAISMAIKESRNKKLHNIRFVESDVMAFDEEADTVIQNPPFGAQKANKKAADVIFLDKAIKMAPVVYSFHMKKTMDFLEKFIAARNATVSHIFEYRFPIPRIYDFHTKESVEVEIVVLRIENNLNH